LFIIVRFLLKCSILTIIVFEYLLLDPSSKKGPKLLWGQKIQGCTSPMPLTSRAYGPLQAYHLYNKALNVMVMLLQTNRVWGFWERIFSLFFTRWMGRLVAWLNAPEF